MFKALSSRRLVALILVALVPALAAAAKPHSSSQEPSARQLIERAKAAVEAGTVDPARDLAPLLEHLAATHDASEQGDLVRAIEQLGEHDGANPAAVKAYLLEAAPPVLLALAGNRAADANVRCDALMALRSLNVADGVLDQGIAIANAETGTAQHQIKFRGELLANWKESRRTAGETPAAPAPVSSAKERAALEYLRQHHQRVSPEALGQAALQGDAGAVTALLDAGLDVNAPTVAGLSALGEAAGIGCVQSETPLESRLATIDVLLAHGAAIKRRDSSGNTVLMFAMQCPLPVIARLVAAGAPLEAVNAQGFKPLQAAFANGRWDAAELLVGHGSRLSKKAIGQLFFEKPTDPRKLALIRAATAAP